MAEKSIMAVGRFEVMLRGHIAGANIQPPTFSILAMAGEDNDLDALEKHALEEVANKVRAMFAEARKRRDAKRG